MIFSTVKRMVGLALLFSLILFSGAVFLSDTGFKIASQHPLETTSSLSAIDETMALKDKAEPPVLQLASLSVMTDYPSTELSSSRTKPLLNTDDSLLRAKELAEVQEFEEALSILETVQTSDKNDYAVSFLKAKILSWSGKHYEAEKVFKSLRRQYPQDADLAVSYAYLHLYQSNFDDAERLFSKVIRQHPEYIDAQNGLKRARAARTR